MCVSAGRAAEPQNPGIVEHLGQTIPMDIHCLDERGAEVNLKALVDRPTILSLVYYSCEHVCPQVLVALGRLVGELPLAAGTDYRVITLSFDPLDKSLDAAKARLNYTRPLAREFPDTAWMFLTAAEGDIRALTDRLGFNFEKEEHGFVHPAVLVILGPGGLISRYVYPGKYAYGAPFPVTFPAVAMADSLRRAALGETGDQAHGPVLFCFPHEPPGQPKYYALMRLAGWATLALLAAFFFYLRSGRGTKAKAGDKND
jgi:protein SCO1/2